MTLKLELVALVEKLFPIALPKPNATLYPLEWSAVNDDAATFSPPRWDNPMESHGDEAKE